MRSVAGESGSDGLACVALGATIVVSVVYWVGTWCASAFMERALEVCSTFDSDAGGALISDYSAVASCGSRSFDDGESEELCELLVIYDSVDTCG